MGCCHSYCAAEIHFDRKIAERDADRYHKSGPDPSTRLLLEETRRFQLAGRKLLDIGGGIGVIGAELADAGLASTTMVEASPAYIEVARREAGSRYASDSAQFIVGDFATMARSLPDADVVTLDRVVCCYPDGEFLLREAAARARETLAFTYPRDRWYVRMMIGLENILRRLRGNPFRALVHSPKQMRETLQACGLTPAVQRKTLVWALEVYRRESP